MLAAWTLFAQTPVSTEEDVQAPGSTMKSAEEILRDQPREPENSGNSALTRQVTAGVDCEFVIELLQLAYLSLMWKQRCDTGSSGKIEFHPAAKRTKTPTTFCHEG